MEKGAWRANLLLKFFAPRFWRCAPTNVTLGQIGPYEVLRVGTLPQHRNPTTNKPYEMNMPMTHRNIVFVIFFKVIKKVHVSQQLLWWTPIVQNLLSCSCGIIDFLGLDVPHNAHSWHDELDSSGWISHGLHDSDVCRLPGKSIKQFSVIQGNYRIGLVDWTKAWHMPDNMFTAPGGEHRYLLPWPLSG